MPVYDDLFASSCNNMSVTTIVVRGNNLKTCLLNFMRIILILEVFFYLETYNLFPLFNCSIHLRNLTK